MASVVDDNDVREPNNQRLGGQKCDLLMSRVFQDDQWFCRQPLSASLLEGGLRYLQAVTVQDDGTSRLAGCDFDFRGSLESQSGEICMDQEIIMNWDDVLRKPHFLPREWSPITSFWRHSVTALTPGTS